MSELMKQKINEIFKQKVVPGDIGIEIEIEGGNYPYPTPPNPWLMLGDGSLRGFSAEYVLKHPIYLSEVMGSLTNLYNTIKNSDANPTYSFRAGVHIHINCQEMTLAQVRNFAILYYTFENIFTDWCGSDRVGNYFCLRVVDAEEVLHRVAKLLSQKTLTNQWKGKLLSEDIRYAALNWTSLPKFGSLEFRTLATDPTISGFTKIKLWANILYNLREESKKFSSPEEILERFSLLSPENFSKHILGKHYILFKDHPKFKQNMWDGVRTAQDLILFME